MIHNSLCGDDDAYLDNPLTSDAHLLPAELGLSGDKPINSCGMGIYAATHSRGKRSQALPGRRVRLAGASPNATAMNCQDTLIASHNQLYPDRNLNTTGFDIRLTDWNYLDGVHPAETISYLVMEKGQTTLPDGSKVEAGSFTGTTRFRAVPLASPSPRYR